MIGRYFLQDGEGPGIDINPVTTDEEFGDTLAWACEAAIGVFIGMNEVMESVAFAPSLRNVLADHEALDKAQFEDRRVRAESADQTASNAEASGN